MSLSNTLMYEGRLECGSERTASGLLALPHLETVQSELELCLTRPEDLAWIQAALLPNNPVCFLDTTLVSKEIYTLDTKYCKTPYLLFSTAQIRHTSQHLPTQYTT